MLPIVVIFGNKLVCRGFFHRVSMKLESFCCRGDTDTYFKFLPMNGCRFPCYAKLYLGNRKLLKL